VERRYASFIAISLAIVLGSQLLQAYLFPKPPVAEVEAEVAAQAEADAVEGARGDAAEQGAAAAGAPANASAPADDDAPAEVAERSYRTLGSLDPDGPLKMLVTFTSRGAAVQRIELAGSQFHDQDDRSGYLGHLAVESTADGCRVGVVGPGTPAAAAGIRAGDVITTLDGLSILDARSLTETLAKTKPRQTVTLGLLREGSPLTVEATLTRRPLEVVRPEFETQPVADPRGQACDPFSFRLSLESRDGMKRPEIFTEVPGQELQEIDWTLDPASDGTRVRFTRRLPGGLTVAKEYAAVPTVDEAGRDSGYRLALTVELASSSRPTTLVYALDGPTGLPTEGWWYAARIARDWGSLAVRDVAMRFVGEQSTLVSGLKMADGSLDHPATAVLEGKPLSFAGVDALYFASALIPATDSPEAPRLEEVRPLVAGDIPAAARRKLVDVTCRLVSQPITVAADAPVVHRYEIFAGPKRPELLASFGTPGATMDDLVYYGWFGWVARPLIAVLHAIHAVIGNYGIAILLLTVMVRGAMFPISRKQAVSSQKMQVLQPEMKAIAEKYKNDPQKRTKATQELWRKHDYNPMGGCLLVFFQIPIFMGLYRSLATDVELRQAPLFSSAIRWCSNLAAPDMFLDWSNYLPGFLTAPEGWLGPYLNLFPLFTIVLFLWQQKLFMPPAMDEQAQMQQQVMKYMMWFMALMFFKVPCGLCLYFIASSLWGIGERLLLPQTTPAAGAAAAATPAPTKTIDAIFKPAGKGKATVGAADAARQKRESRKKR
jgi:YidC/Oxa1 family membrane protein insertase